MDIQAPKDQLGLPVKEQQVLPDLLVKQVRQVTLALQEQQVTLDQLV
jgi:hypothetical protein